jgi:transcriptional regulator with XRE-family HTH domain
MNGKSKANDLGLDASLSLLGQLGMRIAFLREQRGLSQLELAIRAGVSKSYVSDLENGRRNPSIKVLQKVASGLGVSLEKLFQGIVPIDF